GADLGQRAAQPGNPAAHLGREIVAADGERLAPQDIAARTFDRTGRHARRRQSRHVKGRTEVGDEAGVATGAGAREGYVAAARCDGGVATGAGAREGYVAAARCDGGAAR